MNEMIMDILHDSLPMLPFLFITYILMEYLEHKSSDAFKRHLQSAKKLGPFIGAVLGIVPQCGFSVLASGLYMNRAISLGTLIAVFISTSDEAIPILVAHPEQINVLFKVVFVKFLIAIFVGYFVDALIRNNKLRQNHPLHNIHAECDKENIENSSIVSIAFVHTMKIFLFIFIVNVLLSVGIHSIGEDRLATLLASGSYLQPVLAAVVGLIPNCAASVMLAQLAMDGVISFGSLTAGLITSAGLGLLVLFKMYDNKRDIIRILSILMGCAILSGIFLQFFG